MENGILYCRVSTMDKQENSLENQREKLVAYCKAFSINIVEVIEEKASGKNVSKREGLKRALNMLKNQEANKLIVVKLDRLTRSVRDLGSLLDLFNENNISLVSLNETIDSSTVAGRLMINLLTSVAEWERETIVERVTEMSHHLKKNNRVYGEIAYGKSRVGKNLVSNESELKNIKLIMKMREKGMAYNKIATALNNKNILTKKGKHWASMQVRNICVNSNF